MVKEEHERIHINLARLKSHGHKFEIVVHPDQAIAFKQGTLADIKDVLSAEKVFFDAQKGLMAGENEMMSVFGTKDPLKVAERIIKEGEIQLSAHYREALRAQKRQRIIYLIHRNAVDPRTNLPHPASRIELAFDEAKVKIDEFHSAEDQVQDILGQLRPILPIKFEIVQMRVQLPAQVAHKAYHVLKSFGTVTKDDWRPDGSLISTVEMPAGLQAEFYDAINKATHGAAQATVAGTR